MDRTLYLHHLEREDTHWWFLGRRRIIQELIAKLGLKTPLRILDIGSGTGGLLSLLLPFGEVSALEGDGESANRIGARYENKIKVYKSFLESADFTNQIFDLITSFDVLEHIEKDEEALDKIYALLAPGGTFLITVPACPFLWSGHDEMNDHFRRYLKAELRSKLEKAGFEVDRISYFNFFLFLPVLLARYYFRLRGRIGSDIGMPSSIINQALLRIFSAERFFLRWANFPLGVSIFAIARKVEKRG